LLEQVAEPGEGFLIFILRREARPAAAAPGEQLGPLPVDVSARTMPAVIVRMFIANCPPP